MILQKIKLIISTNNVTGILLKAKNNKKRKVFLIMDDIIDGLITKYKLSDYEALVVTGIVGILAESNDNIQEIYKDIDTKLKPIVNEIINN